MNTHASNTPIPYSQRPLPAVHCAAIELLLIVARRGTDRRLPRALASPLQRNLRAACTAIFRAAHGTRPARELQRAKDSLLSSFSLLVILFAEGHLDETFYRDAESRVDLILGGIDLLDPGRLEEWASQPAPPAPASIDDGLTSVLARTKTIVDRVAQLANSAPPDQSSDAGPSDGNGTGHFTKRGSDSRTRSPVSRRSAVQAPSTAIEENEAR